MKLTIAVFLAAASFAAFAAEPANEIDGFSNSGGIFRLKGKGFVAVIDCRAQPNPLDYAEGRNSVLNTYYLDIFSQKGQPFALENAKEQLKSSGANAAVFIADNTSLPISLSACEENWAMLNAAKLREDKPDSKTFARRLSVLFVRQFCRALGSDECEGTDAAFHAIHTLKDIDDIKSLDVTFGPETSVKQTLSTRGLEIIEIGSYEDACQLGIAPQPTNDLQRVIWNTVHALPKNPITIQPEVKPVKK